MNIQIWAIFHFHLLCSFFLFLLQMAAWAAIIFLTAESDNLATGLAQQLQSVAGISQAAAVISTSIVPATVTVINAIMPIIIKARTGSWLARAQIIKRAE